MARDVSAIGGRVDNCGIASMELSQTFFHCTHLGANTVELTVTDIHSNSSSCTATITVGDTRDPTIVCPADTVRSANSGCGWRPEDGGGASILGTPTAEDNCSKGLTVTSNAPDFFPLCVTEVTWTATDSSGNSVSCVQLVTVVDDTPPTLTCPANITGNPNNGDQFVTGSELGDATATDNCSASGDIVLSNDAPPSFPIGETLVTWTATDPAGNSSSCQQEVIVVDTTVPMLTCPGDNISTLCTGADGAVVQFDVTATDNTGDDNATVVCEPPSGSTFPLGITTVVCTATDPSGNTATCSFEVEVLCGGFVLPGDCDGSGSVDVTDAVCILSILFAGSERRLSCGDGSIQDPANVALLSWNGSSDVDLTSAIALLNWKFLGGHEHTLGRACVPIEDCVDVCD